MAIILIWREWGLLLPLQGACLKSSLDTKGSLAINGDLLGIGDGSKIKARKLALQGWEEGH